MALNNIELNSLLLTDLYRTSLVEINQNDQKKVFTRSSFRNENAGNNSSPIDSIATSWQYLGDYRKNILIIVRYADFAYIPDDQLNFLTSALGACNLSLGDIAVLNLANAPSVVHKDIQSKFKSAIMILFGVTPAELEMPVNFPEFQVQTFDHCTILHTPALENLETDKILKSKFWVCLRKVFGI